MRSRSLTPTIFSNSLEFPRSIPIEILERPPYPRRAKHRLLGWSQTPVNLSMFLEQDVWTSMETVCHANWHSKHPGLTGMNMCRFHLAKLLATKASPVVFLGLALRSSCFTPRSSKELHMVHSGPSCCQSSDLFKNHLEQLERGLDTHAHTHTHTHTHF